MILALWLGLELGGKRQLVAKWLKLAQSVRLAARAWVTHSVGRIFWVGEVVKYRDLGEGGYSQVLGPSSTSVLQRLV